jgi:hypothetical protein
VRRRLRLLSLVVFALSCVSPALTYAISDNDSHAVNYDTVFYDPLGSCPNGVGGATALTGDNNAIRAYNFFIGKGLSPAQAAGIVGNMIEESGVGPERLQGTPGSQVTTAQQMVSSGQYQSAIGWGIVQWTPADQSGNGVIITSSQPSAAVNTLAYQLDALWKEINGPMKVALDAVKATNTPSAAAEAWLTHFELGAPNPQREIFAIAIYQFAVNHTPLPPSVLGSIVPESAANPGNGAGTAGTGPTSANPCGSTAAVGPSGCANPFRDTKHLVPERIDQGIDYAGDGTVYAVCSGTILNLANLGWCFGGACAFISIKIDSGPYKGLVSYMAEGCATASLTHPPHVGDHVSTTTVICNLLPGSTGIETGWATLAGNGTPLAQLYGGNGSCTTTAGESYNRFLKSLGTPSGLNECSPTIGQPLPKPYP